MNKRGLLFLVLLTLPAVVPSAMAAEGAPKIGVIIVDKVLKEYKGTQAKEAEFQKLSEGKQQEREKKVSEIRGLRDELALLNEENRDRQRAQIEQKLQALAMFDQQAKASLAEMREEALTGLFKDMESVVGEMAKTGGYDLVLTDRAVLFRVDALDMTDEVIKALNERQGKAAR